MFKNLANNLIKFSNKDVNLFMEKYNCTVKRNNPNDLDGGHFTGTSFDKVLFIKFNLIRFGVNWKNKTSNLVLINFDYLEKLIIDLIMKDDLIRDYIMAMTDYKNKESEYFENLIGSFQTVIDKIIKASGFDGNLNIYIDCLDNIIDIIESKIKEKIWK